MKKTTLIKLFLFLNIANSFANKDIILRLDTLQNQSLRRSDLVFLGSLIRIDTINSTLQFNVVEVFKGHPKVGTVIIAAEKHNRIYFEDKSLWIVYSNYRSDKSLVLNEFGLTRSIIHPEVIRAYLIPPPPPEKMDQIEMIWYYNQWTDYKLNALKDWYVELEQLRKLHNTQHDEKDNFQIFLFLSLIFNLTCLLIIINLLMRIKRANH
jgi:hypothetical protein